MSYFLPYLAHQGSYRHWTDGVGEGDKPVMSPHTDCTGGAIIILYSVAGYYTDQTRASSANSGL